MGNLRQKGFWVTLLFVFSGIHLQGQTLRGKVLDALTQEALGYATVEIHSCEDNAYLAGGVTGNTGEFLLTLKQPAGKVRITASYLGYKSQEQLHTFRPKDNYLRFELVEDAHSLNEVIVKGLSQAEKVQRLAYNVSLIETTQLKNTTLDLSSVIDKISGVKIRSTGGVGSESNVTLNGFSGRHVKIFIDGVPMDGMSSAFGLNNIPRDWPSGWRSIREWCP